MDEIVENDFYRFYTIDGILFSENKGDGYIDGEAAKKIVEMRHQISNNASQYWCMDTRTIKSFDKEARDYSDKYGQEFLFACGVLVDSHVTKFMFNTYLKLKNPLIPMQVFTKKEEAVKWLKQIKFKNENK